MKQSVKLVAGNWKMNGLGASLAEAETLEKALKEQAAACRVALCPPATLIDRMAQALKGGHSERRAGFGETDADVAAKVEAALAADLEPIICIGETLQEREAGQAVEVISRQVAGSLPASLAGKAFAVAYEPVWAIGTGLTPTLEQIEEVHAAVRAAMIAKLGDGGRVAPILYGGSVKPSNAKEILAVAEVGGALVGGASLKAEDFLGIIRAV
ncbi:MAG: triosephosphate isomerase [Brevundimonas diminuta]|nr:triosephosphate isomerase [Brevundimonas diminuta]